VTHVEATHHWFQLLDGRTIAVYDRCWQIHLYSLHTEDNCRWLQLALRGDSTHMITLRLACDAGEAEVVSALADWLARPDEQHRTLLCIGAIHGRPAEGDRPIEANVPTPSF
jgi:hypothetical protein